MEKSGLLRQTPGPRATGEATAQRASRKRGPRRVTRASSPQRDRIPLDRLGGWVAEWSAELSFGGRSKTTVEKYRFAVESLRDHAAASGAQSIGRAQVMAWCQSLRDEGRRPLTVTTYFGSVRAMCNWMVRRQYLAVSPVEDLDAPRAAHDQVKTFTDDQARSLLRAATTGAYPLRDEAIISVLLETGIRASELVGLRRQDLDIDQHSLTVLGKGNRYRTVPFGYRTRLSLMRWCNSVVLAPEDPLFPAMRAAGAGSPMTRSGLQQIVERVGKAAGIQGVRLSPHTCRHYAAVAYLRANADQFAVKALLGHSSVRATERYVDLAQADLQAKVLRNSPLDRLDREKRR